MDAVSLALAKNYTNEKLNSLPSNAPTKTVTFDGGIYSVGSDVVNGQVSDIVLLGRTYTNGVINGDFSDSTNGWFNSIGSLAVVDNIMIGTSNGASSTRSISTTANIPVASNKKVYIKARFRTRSENATKLEFYVRGSITSGTVQKITFNNPEKDRWYYINDIISLPSNMEGNIHIAFWMVHESAEQSEGQVLEIDGNYGVLAVDLTSLGETETDTDKLSQKYHFINGTKSTNSVRIKSIGKNLFDEPKIKSQLDKISKAESFNMIYDGNLLTVSGQNEISAYGYKKVWLIQGKTYTVVVDGYKDAGAFGNVGLYKLTLAGSIGAKVAGVALSNTRSIKTVNTGVIDATGYYALTYFPTYYTSTQSNMYIYSVMLKDSTVLDNSYEPYKESIAYINGAGELRSLPNGVKDEVNIGLGQKIQRIKKYVLQADDIISFSQSGTYVDLITIRAFSDFSAGQTWQYAYPELITDRTTGRTTASWDLETSYWTHAFDSSKKIYIYVPKGTYANLTEARSALAGTTLIYQLAEPVVTKLPAQAPLQVFENGTVYVEPIGDPSETTLPTVELTVPIGAPNKFGSASHDYEGAAADWVLNDSEQKCLILVATNSGGNANIILPKISGLVYLVDNKTDYNIVCKSVGDVAGTTILSGNSGLIYNI